jgi:hypothetical protein
MIIKPRPTLQSATDTTKFARPTSSALPELTQREKSLQKALTKVAPDVRENVTATLQLAIHQNAAAKRDLSILNVENVSLKAELRTKQLEIQNLSQQIGRYKQQIEELEETNYAFKDKLEFRNKFLIASKKSSSKIESVNKMLLQCLESLQVEKNRSPASISPQLTMINQSEANMTEPQEIILERQITTYEDPGQQTIINDDEKNATSFDEKNASRSRGNESKLRESFLRVTNELSHLSRKNKLLEEKLIELSAALKRSQHHGKALENELSSLKSTDIMNHPVGSMNEMGADLFQPVVEDREGWRSSEQTPIRNIVNDKYIAKRKEFDSVDQRLQVL